METRLAALLLLCCAAGFTAEPPASAEETSYLAGRLLIAAPGMGDPRFAETVVYIVHHDENGAMGLVINRPIGKAPLSDLLRRLGTENKNATGEILLHYGGPVEPERAFVLHTADYTNKSSQIMGNGIAVTADLNIVQAIAEEKGPKQSLFCLGYAGWARGQLEGEMMANAWFAVPTEEKLIFEGDSRTMWERAMARRGVKT